MADDAPTLAAKVAELIDQADAALRSARRQTDPAERARLGRELFDSIDGVRPMLLRFQGEEQDTDQLFAHLDEVAAEARELF